MIKLRLLGHPKSLLALIASYFTAGEAICMVKNDIGGGIFSKLLFAENQDTPCQQHDAKRGSDQQGGENLLCGAGP